MAERDLLAKLLEVTDMDTAEIAHLILGGNTSGVLDNENGTRVVWELKIDKFKNN